MLRTSGNPIASICGSSGTRRPIADGHASTVAGFESLPPNIFYEFTRAYWIGGISFEGKGGIWLPRSFSAHEPGGIGDTVCPWKDTQEQLQIFSTSANLAKLEQIIFHVLTWHRFFVMACSWQAVFQTLWDVQISSLSTWKGTVDFQHQNITNRRVGQSSQTGEVVCNLQNDILSLWPISISRHGEGNWNFDDVQMSYPARGLRLIWVTFKPVLPQTEIQHMTGW